MASVAATLPQPGNILWVNEDWYGHQNSSVNLLDPDNAEGVFWQYRVIRENNPGMELGCTCQFGAFWEGRYYFISKQDKDPGASISGGRITVVDAATMKIIHQSRGIDPSGAQCDGRAFVGVDAHKGYVSSSNGVWVLDLDNFEIRGQIAGTANPEAGDGNDRPNSDATGALYKGQTGTMVLASRKVFVAHQQYGLLVIDPATDTLTDIIPMSVVAEGAGIGSIVRVKDGSLWLSIAKNTNGTGDAMGCLVRVNPETLEWSVVTLPEEVLPPGNSWYAWTPDAFTASGWQNCLYWKGGAGRWFSGSKIYKYEIDSGTASLFVDLDNDPHEWKIYGCSMGCDPSTDELYVSLYHEFGKPDYMVRRYSPAGTLVSDYPMIQNYWFPSRPIFVETFSPGDGVSSVYGTQRQLAYTDGCLTLEGDAGASLHVYTIQGIEVMRKAPTCTIEKVEVNLAPGVYVATYGGSSLKFVVR